MADLFNGLFGGSNSQSTSNTHNRAYPYLQSSLSPEVSNGVNSDNILMSLLGGKGTDAQNAAFKNWQGSTGYQFGLNQGTQAITQNNAAKGLLNSGSTARAVDTYGQQYANQQYQNYINPLFQLLQGGNQAAGIIGGAGNVSNSQSTSFDGGKGIAGGLGSIFTGI